MKKIIDFRATSIPRRSRQGLPGTTSGSKCGSVRLDLLRISRESLARPIDSDPGSGTGPSCQTRGTLIGMWAFWDGDEPGNQLGDHWGKRLTCRWISRPICQGPILFQ